MKKTLVAGLMVALWMGSAGRAAPVRDRHVEAELVAAETALVPGRVATVALRLSHDEHWHTYWQNPGEAGLPTEIKWQLPEGFAAGPIQWPVPHLIETGGIFNYGYEGEVLLLTELAVPASAKPGATVELRADVSWLMCKESCIPGEAKLSLTLPVAAVAAPDPRWSARLAAARAALPKPIETLAARGYRNGKTITLVVESRAALNPAIAGVAFFSADSAVDAQALAVPTRKDQALQFVVPQAAAAANPAKLAGLLIATEGWIPGGPAAVVVDIPVTDGPVPTDATAATGGLAGVLALAFVGGLILNLMPCVFPVLGIKILGFVQQAGEDRTKVKLHGLAFAGGVLMSFWLLAGVLIALRAGGAQIGWGFQLQQPGFVFALVIVMLVFALSMSGVFEIGGSLIGAGVGLQSKSGLAGSFFSGVLATVVATPCSAPFLAPALGAALTLGPAESLLVFTCIALGLAVPYLAISLFPVLIKVLPRPGAWMETFKQFMAFPLYATSGYLIWVLAGQVDDYGLLFALLGLTVVAMAAWVLGRWATISREPRVRWTGRLAALALLGAGVALGLPRAPAANHVEWQPWSTEAVAKLRAENRLIYVDFTARWCVTCQANKASVFSSAEVLRTFGDRQVAALRGDWTNRDPKITAELQRFNRAAVPMDLVYLPGRADPILLPEVLTPGTVLAALKTADK